MRLVLFGDDHVMSAWWFSLRPTPQMWELEPEGMSNYMDLGGTHIFVDFQFEAPPSQPRVSRFEDL